MDRYTNIDTKVFRGSGYMTVAKYNNSGEIIYIADKDSKHITAIETCNHNIIGNFYGHGGVVWSLDIASNDKILVSCSGDLSIIFWDTDTGNKIHQINEKCIPKYVCVQKKLITNLVAVICEGLGKKSSTYILIYDLDNFNSNNKNSNNKNSNNDIDINHIEKSRIIWRKVSKPTVMVWLNELELIVGCDDGNILILNINNDNMNNETDKPNKPDKPDKPDKTDKCHEYQIHNNSIKSIVWNKTKTQILTGSLDCTAKQIDVKSWEIKATYKSTVPINWACWNYNEKKIFVGGGIDAMSVAKTSNNDLNLKIYRTLDQKLINHIGSHFGPIRYIDKSPVSKNFLTASQDGTVKIYFINDDANNLQSAEINKNLKNFTNSQSQLSSETNKIENLSWIPKPTIEIKYNWIPGMPQPNTQSNTQSKSNGIVKMDNFDCDDHNHNQIKNDDKKNCSIKVTNLPPDIRKEELADIFDLHGRIVERDGIKIKTYENRFDKNTIDKQTIAYINYVYPEAASKAIEHLNHTDIDHYIINVEYAKSRK